MNIDNFSLSILCYVVMPQGMRTSLELGYKLLGRVFGDICKEDKLARIADSLYPDGDTYEELAQNYEEPCSKTF